LANNKLVFIRSIIYKLKRSYGLPVDLYKINQHSREPTTGVKTTVVGKIRILKAIVLEARQFRSFVYDLAYISANKDFTAGAFFDPEDRLILVDSKDLDKYEPKVGDYFIFQNRRYDVSESFPSENNYAYICRTKAIRGAVITRIEDGFSVLNLGHDVTYTVSDVKGVLDLLNLTQSLVEVP
jgi:hypothetical protein